MGRYDLPGPKCRHVRKPGSGALVSSHDLGQPVPRDEPLASTWVCDREACVEDAKEWVYASTHRTPLVTRRGQRTSLGTATSVHVRAGEVFGLGTLNYTAGEDLRPGDMLAVDTATGKVVRQP